MITSFTNDPSLLGSFRFCLDFFSETEERKPRPVSRRRLAAVGLPSPFIRAQRLSAPQAGPSNSPVPPGFSGSEVRPRSNCGSRVAPLIDGPYHLSVVDDVRKGAYSLTFEPVPPLFTFSHAHAFRRLWEWVAAIVIVAVQGASSPRRQPPPPPTADAVLSAPNRPRRHPRRHPRRQPNCHPHATPFFAALPSPPDQPPSRENSPRSSPSVGAPECPDPQRPNRGPLGCQIRNSTNCNFESTKRISQNPCSLRSLFFLPKSFEI